MRKTQYYCDHCDKEFAGKSHLNLKGLMLFASIPNHSDPKNTHWASKCISQMTGHEAHFCNLSCFYKWLQKLQAKMIKKMDKCLIPKKNA